MIRVDGPDFKDEFDRTLMLRGVNLGGSSKVPTRPDGATYRREGFFDHSNVSFVGRPFPLQEADEHFSRLRAWGLTFVRFLVSWEAIEHSGPGIYDEEYLDYIRAMIAKAAEYGINVFIDPHQDVWSRFTGGDGAPGWTLEAIGFDMTHFAETGAAIVHATHGDPFPQMIWPTNGSKLAAATMFTLFFAGNDFAPQTKINGEPVQEFLQRHYIQSIQQVAMRLKDLPNVIGYDTMNEPLSGYIGWEDLNTSGGLLILGESPTSFQSMLLGEGIPQEVQTWKLGLIRIKRAGRHLLNKDRVRAWQEGVTCIWRRNGVWDFDSNGVPCLLQPNYFSQVKGRKVDIIRDYYHPFANRFLAAIRQVDPRALIFLEAGHRPPVWDEKDAPGIVYAPHWYDGFTLIRKEFTPWIAADSIHQRAIFGRGAIRRVFARELSYFKRCAGENLCGAPTVVGEFGIPFDLNHKQAYRTGNFSAQAQAMDRSFQAIEANLLHCTLWDYTSDNTNQRGDQWNDEDFSIFSRDQQSNPENIHSGGRALRAVVRPYPVATAGNLLWISFDMKHRFFTMEFSHNPQAAAPTEIYLPEVQYPDGCVVEVSDGDYEIHPETQTLIYQHSHTQNLHTIRVHP